MPGRAPSRPLPARLAAAPPPARAQEFRLLLGLSLLAAPGECIEQHVSRHAHRAFCVQARERQAACWRTAHLHRCIRSRNPALKSGTTREYLCDLIPNPNSNPSHLQSQHVLPAVIADLEDERLRPGRLLLATPPALIHLAANGDCTSHACTGNRSVVQVMHVHKDSQEAGCCSCHGEATYRSWLCLVGPHLPVHTEGTSGNKHGTCL